MKILVLNIRIVLLFILFCFTSLEAISGQKQNNSFFLHGGYTFESFSGQKNAAVYISAFNYSDKDIIINSVTTEISEISEIHEIKKNGNIMKMSKIEKLKIKANDSFFFQPGGTHIMLMNLKKELKDGEQFILKFLSDSGDTIEANIKVLNTSLRNSKDGI